MLALHAWAEEGTTWPAEEELCNKGVCVRARVRACVRACVLVCVRVRESVHVSEDMGVLCHQQLTPLRQTAGMRVHCMSLEYQ